MSKSKHRADDLERLKAFRLMDDDFMSACFEGNKECAEVVLHTILEKPDLKVEHVETQRSLQNLQGRSIRLDIFARDSKGKVYNIEIQRADRGATAKRARYYSSLIDVDLLDPGDYFNQLAETYIIFITEKDVWRDGLGLYHFDRICRETGKLMNDGVHIVYVNGEYRDNTPLGALMSDFSCNDPDDIKNPVLSNRVRYLKQTEKGVASMCKMMEDMRSEAEKIGADGRTIEMIFDMAENDEPIEKIAKYAKKTIEETKRIIAGGRPKQA